MRRPSWATFSNGRRAPGASARLRRCRCSTAAAARPASRTRAASSTSRWRATASRCSSPSRTSRTSSPRCACWRSSPRRRIAPSHRPAARPRFPTCATATATSASSICSTRSAASCATGARRCRCARRSTRARSRWCVPWGEHGTEPGLGHHLGSMGRADDAAEGSLMPRASLVALAFGNFVIGTGTLIVPGMLPHLAEGLGVSLPLAGQLITAFAATVCVAAPLLAGATSRYDRRALLAAMQLLFVVGHLAAALVSSFTPMLLVRMVTSIGAALFTAQAASAAALLVPPQERGRAIAFVFMGWSVAAVLGLPLGAYVGATFGWRAGFALVAGLSALGAGAVWTLLPAGLRVQPVDGAMWRAILANSGLLAVIAVTALVTAAGFSLFAYFVPAAHAFIDASPAQVSLLLCGLGVM